MIKTHLLLLLASGCLSSALQDQVTRQTRTPGLLHLAHAGHPVGSYVLAGPRASGGGGGGVGGGGGGPHIVIVGNPGAAHVTTHQAGRESLEEIDEEIRQHYGRPIAPHGIRYVPNSSHRGLYHEPRTLPGYGGSLGSHAPGPVGLPLRYGLYQQPQVGHGFTQATTFVGHPLPQTHQASPHQAPQPSAYRPTPSPLAHYPSPSPLAHTLATPVRLPLHGLSRYPPVFIPLQGTGAAPYNHQFGLSQSHPPAQPQYSHSGYSSGRSPAYSSEQSEGKSQYFQGSQERRSEYSKYPSNYPDTQERRPESPRQESDYYGSGERSQQAYSEFDKSYKFGSEESGAKAATTVYQSYPDEDDTSSEVSSGERAGSYKFFEGQSSGSGGGGYGVGGGGSGKGVATSYQSVTLETGHSSPRYQHHSQEHP